MKTNENQRKPNENPMKTNENQRKPTKTNENQRKPTKTNENQRKPTKTNENQRNPTKTLRANGNLFVFEVTRLIDLGMTTQVPQQCNQRQLQVHVTFDEVAMFQVFEEIVSWKQEQSHMMKY